MKRFATAFGLAVILSIAGLLYLRGTRQHRVPSPAIQEQPESAAATLVFPATSELWSNLNSRAAAPVTAARFLPRGTTAVGTNSPPAELVNESAVQARSRELLARAALESVGLDSDADQFWLAAITDENLPSEDRHELILGLNEAGLGDPTRLGLDDLPLIVGRIALLEEAAPHAVDSSDAAAFQAAHRDLLGLLSAVTSQSISTNTPAE